MAAAVHRLLEVNLLSAKGTLQRITKYHYYYSKSPKNVQTATIILALTFIQGHTDLNHENNNCLIISESEDSPTKGLHDNCQSDDLDLH